MEQKHTPEPWRWEFNERHKTVSIVGGAPKFDLTVMDFERWGMGGAVPRFRDTAHDGMNVMHRLCDRPDWIAPAKGREHHASWFANVIHPDARRIVACVNACAGIATEQLERHYNAGGGIDSAMEESELREQIAVYKQRDQLRHCVERAERALQRAGWTYIEGADEWKPPIGPSASPLLSRIDQLQAERDQLVERINKTLGEAVTYMNQRDMLLEALECLFDAYSAPDGGEIDKKLAMIDARAAIHQTRSKK